jgi:hypothetical protein
MESQWFMEFYVHITVRPYTYSNGIASNNCTIFRSIEDLSVVSKVTVWV